MSARARDPVLNVARWAFVFAFAVACHSGLSTPELRRKGPQANLVASSLPATEQRGALATALPLDAAAPSRGTGRAPVRRAHPGDTPALDEFFRRLRSLSQGGQEMVRVLWLGDSHTAADFMTSRVRKRLQARFGDGGPGFVPFGLRGTRHETILTRTNGPWRHEPPSPAAPRRQLDGVYGLPGQRGVPEGETASAEARPKFASKYNELHWQFILRFAPKASASMNVNGVVTRLPKEASEKDDWTFRVRGSQLRSFDVTAASDATFELSRARGTVELFGAIAETSGPGLVLDAVGLNGARIWTPRGWHAGTFLGEVAERDPQLVVLSYGTNEASDGVPLERYAEAYRALLGDLRVATNTADCMLVGPTARGDDDALERAVEVEEFQRRLAPELGCAYFSLMRVMGGERGFQLWRTAQPARAARDGVHLTRAGYDRLGEALADFLVTAYERWLGGPTRP